MTLHARLLACMNQIQGAFLCDVGTDHALLPVYALQQGRIKKAIACDIGRLPLEAAESTVRKYQLAESVMLVLSDGLQDIPDAEMAAITDIVIAGMGGETIIHILETNPFPEMRQKQHFILQPMTKPELLRIWLFRNGYEIQQEDCVQDGRFLYAILSVRYSGICKNPDAREVYFGEMNLSDRNGLSYAMWQYRKLCTVRDGRNSAGQDVTEFDRDICVLKTILSEYADMEI